MVIAGYRDWGVSHTYYDCPIDYCAHISFADTSDPKMSLVSVLVNMQSNKVVGIRAARDFLVAKTNDVEEVKSFLSRYPDANVRINPGPGYSEVIYEAETTTKILSLVVRTTPIGVPTGLHAECFGGDEIIRVSDNVAGFIETTDCLD